MVVGVQVHSCLILLMQVLRLNESVGEQCMDNEIQDGLLPFVKDFLCLMIAPSTTAREFTDFVYSELADAGYTSFPLSELVDMLHTRLTRSLQESIPIALERVIELRYIGLSSNDRITLEVEYEQ